MPGQRRILEHLNIVGKSELESLREIETQLNKSYTCLAVSLLVLCAEVGAGKIWAESHMLQVSVLCSWLSFSLSTCCLHWGVGPSWIILTNRVPYLQKTTECVFFSLITQEADSVTHFYWPVIFLMLSPLLNNLQWLPIASQSSTF